MTETSFTFTSLQGHVEGEGGTITFSTHLDSNCNLVLRVHAMGPDFLGIPDWPLHQARLYIARQWWGTMREKLWGQMDLQAGR